MRRLLHCLRISLLGLALGALTPEASASVDETPPEVFCPENITVVAPAGACTVPVEFSVTAIDDTDVAEIISVPPAGSPFPVGTTIVRSTASDSAGNTATCEFVVRVVSGSLSVGACPPRLKVQAPVGSTGIAVTFPAPAVTDPCSTPEVISTPASGSTFPLGITQVISVVRLPEGDREICRFEVEVVSPENIVWPRAMTIPLTDSLGVLTGFAEQSLVEFGESRWYKFRVQPGSRVVATLTSLPANHDLVLFRDIAAAYRALTTPGDLPLLDAEFAEDAFSPAQFSPAQFSPAQFSPAAFSPAQFSPAQFSPAQFSPAQFSPAQFSPAQFSPDAFAPAQFSPAQFSPAQFSPAQFSPAQFSPAQFSPAQFSEAAYAGAQLRSVIAISAFEGRASEGVVANTWNDSGEFYLRVHGRQGAFQPNSDYRLDVFLFPGLCKDVTPIPVDGASVPLPPSATAAQPLGSKTLVLVDFDRLVGAGPSAARSELADKLSTFASRPEVAGQVLDVGQDPWVRFFNQQADANAECPYAKNLVADAIHAIIERSRTGNALQYLVVIGSDQVIPFYRHPDEAMLGPEQDFVPPVFEFSSSQASLRKNFFLSQDRYAARCLVNRKSTQLPLPDLAIGRLVETPAEIMGMIDAYLKTPGGLLPAPQSLLVTGYDFLEDAANAVAAELHAGTGVVPDRLISSRDLAPSDPESWTADQLRALLLPARHDILFLAGHFNAGGALAADFTTRILASELLASATDFENAFFYSPGCHSGYNIIDEHALPIITQQPDWAQVCARKRMTLLAGTGYQYGDTDFIEYSERLYLLFTRQLRTGSGAVSLGSALARAKAQYLASTSDLRGIHEKALLQATLFGLPMLAYDLPGARLAPPPGTSVIPATQAYVSDPPSAGQVLGLRYADLTVNASFSRHELTLKNAERDAGDPGAPEEVLAVWYSGSDGIVTHPAEPVLPLEIRNVTVPGVSLRGIGYRGGEFSDLPNLVPLTGAATTEIRGVHPAFVSDEFFPQRFWRANYFGALCESGVEGTQLFVTPVQVRSVAGADLATLRRHHKSNFRLFYSGNITTYVDPATGASSTPALSAPPTISKIEATPDDEGRVTFKVQVVGNPAAGVQEVWILFTSLTGAFRDRWEPLDLHQSTADSRTWEATLDLHDTPPGDVRFQVQAVNGVGLVTLANNLGQFYTPASAEPAPIPPSPTSVEFLSPPAEGDYGSRVAFRARLLRTGSPIAGQTLLFKVGGLERRAVTDADGVAS
ncbi:MAG: HYR domain-containing protein, partial [Verrucomicrobiales bacterium]|nr:HYR domain-containing protein [Verrucomicrobiales bacterium]